MSRLFIVGAGFSYHLSGGYFPLMKELGYEFKARGVDKLKINILNKGSDAENVCGQICEVGMFGYDDIEITLFKNCDSIDYEAICKS